MDSYKAPKASKLIWGMLPPDISEYVLFVFSLIAGTSKPNIIK